MSSMAGFQGGPLAGQPVTPDTLGQAQQGGMVDLGALQAGMPPGAAGPGPPPAGPGPSAGEPDADESLSASDRLDRALNDLMQAAMPSESTMSEQTKAKVQKAMTLIQDIKAATEKESHDALGGKVSPRLLTQAYGG